MRVKVHILLVCYNNDSFIHYFPMGIAYVASRLRNEGNDVKIYQQDIYHWHENHLVQYLQDNPVDVVGIGMCAGSYQYQKLKKICYAIQLVSPTPQIWLGGHMVAPAVEYFKKLVKADFVCPGEFDYEKDLDNIPLPAWDLFDMGYYSLIRLPNAENEDRCFPVLSGRGCPFRCNFCYRIEEGYRSRSVKGIKEEIQQLIKDYFINYIDFADELLMVSPERIKLMCEMMKPLHLKWMCNGRLNLAKLELLQLMKDAGCVFINYGIEAVDDTVLENMNKHLTIEQIIKGIEVTLSLGMSPGLNLIWGNIGDNKETLWKAVDFIVKYSDNSQMRTIRPVTPYPGSPLYEEAVKRGLIKDVADFYEKKHKGSNLLTVNFTNLSDDEYYRELFNANKRLMGHYYNSEFERMVGVSKNLYETKDTEFRGFRRT